LPAIDAQDRFWAAALPQLMDWSRRRIAEALSTEQRIVTPDDLAFWPTGEDPGEIESRVTEIAERVWPDGEELERLVESHLSTVSGYYGRGGAPSYRFEVRVTLPGTLLRTNGTPDERSVVWLFREEDLGFGTRALRAESVALDEEKLTALGARRRLERARLLQLVDLLWQRDVNGALVETLALAVEDGNLERLREESAVDDELLALARELADLLDPEIPVAAPL
jgi:hypothetical protein